MPATAAARHPEAVDARRAVLGAADVDGRGIKVNLLPANVDQLTDPQRMPEGQEDQQPVARRVAAVAGSVHQRGNLALCQILALPVIGVLGQAAGGGRRERASIAVSGSPT